MGSKVGNRTYICRPHIYEDRNHIYIYEAHIYIYEVPHIYVLAVYALTYMRPYIYGPMLHIYELVIYMRLIYICGLFPLADAVGFHIYICDKMPIYMGAHIYMCPVPSYIYVEARSLHSGAT